MNANQQIMLDDSVTDSKVDTDKKSPRLEAKSSVEWQQQISAIAMAAGRKEAQIVRDAIAQYLGKTDPHSVKGAIASLEDRVASLEGKLAGLGRLVG